MKVLHVIPSVGPIRGGTSQAVLGIVRSLRSAGVEVEIATTNDNGPTLLDVPLGQLLEYEQVPVRFFSRYSPANHTVSEYAFSGDLTRWLWQNLRNYDLLEIHSLFSYACTSAAAIARMQRCPYIFNPHGHFSPWVINQKRRKKQIYAFLIERANLNGAAAIHCNSLGEEQDVRDFGITAPTFTVPLGIDPIPEVRDARQALQQTYGIAPETPIVLFLSRFHPKKRPELLLAALSQLQGQGHHFHLLFAGSGEPEYTATLKQQVADLNLESQVTWPGFVTGIDKDRLLQGADLFVLPSFGENFGIAVAEAMAVGLPVIVTPEVQIATDITAAQSGIVVPGEVEALANAIAQLLTSPSLRQEMGDKGRQLVREQYAWPVVADKLATAYATFSGKPALK